MTVPFAVTVPEHARFPVAPSIVHPVAPDPPAIAIVAADAPLGPILKVAALPPKVRLVGEAKAVNVASPLTEVVNVGLVLITTLPDPVIAFETRFLLPSVKTAWEAESPAKLIVPEEERPVNPEATPAEETSQFEVLIASVPEPPPIATRLFDVPVFIFVGWLFETLRFIPPAPDRAVKVPVVFPSERAPVLVDVPILVAPVPAVFRFNIPEPLGAIVRFAFDVVPSVAAEPPPRFSVVADIPSVAADVNVASDEAVRVLDERAKVPPAGLLIVSPL